MIHVIWLLGRWDKSLDMKLSEDKECLWQIHAFRSSGEN